MRNIFYIAVIAAVVWLWREGKLPGFGATGAYDEQGNAVVLIFTFDGCGKSCQVSLKELERRGVPFQELVVDPNDQSSKNYKQWVTYGKGSFPLIVAGEQKVTGSSEAQLVTLLGENFGVQYLTRTESRYFKRHFNEDGAPKIVMYGTSWCPGCKRLRKEFSDEGVVYIEVDVEGSGELELMTKTMEIGGYPAIWVGYTRVNGVTLSAVKKTSDAI